MNINSVPQLHTLEDTAQLTLKQAHKGNTRFSELMNAQLPAHSSPSQQTTQTPSVSLAQSQTDTSTHHDQAPQTETTKQSDASIEFQEYMAKNDAEKMRLSVLKEMGLTEEEFEQLPPEEQFAIEQKIIARLKQQNGVDSTELNTATDSSVLNIA